jgi:hypothetical protein
LTVTQGANATFTTAASGNPAPSYQWRFGGTNIGGATGSTFTRSNAQPADAGNYTVVATNIAGTATSSVAALIVLVPPNISVQPQNVTTNQGGTANFSVLGGGTTPLGYRWQFDGAYNGVTTTNCTLGNVQPGNAGSYRCIVTNAGGAATSQVATLTVNVPPTITNQPQSLSVKVGSNATFAVLVGGTPPLSYQWIFNTTNIPTATGSSYTRSAAQTNDAGTYYVVISNVAGVVASSNATLTVSPLQPLKFDLVSAAPSNQIRLSLNGEPGNYVIRSSSNFTDWQVWTNVTIGAGPVELLDSVTSGVQRFYRASTAP